METQPTSKKTKLESHPDGKEVDGHHNNNCNTANNTTPDNSNTTTASDDKVDIAENRKKRGSNSECGSRSRFREQQCQSKVICSSSTSEFEKCISKCVNKNDTVLIIRGTEKGNKSYDGGESIAYQTSTKQPIIFQGSSVWESINDLMQIATANKVHVICLEPSNLHGNDLLFDSIALIKLLQSIFSSKAISTSSTTTTTTILVKSKLLAKHAKSFVNVHDFINNGGLSNNDNTKSTNEQIVQVVSAVGVESYRDTIPYVVRPNSRVLEVGCHFGTTTSLIAKATQSPNIVVGIDIGKVCIDRATKKYNGIQFEVIDAWDTASILKLHPSSFDAIYVDVGGMIGADGLFEVLGLVRQLINAYKSSGKLQCIVVKSRCLRDHSVVYKNSDDYLRK